MEQKMVQIWKKHRDDIDPKTGLTLPAEISVYGKNGAKIGNFIAMILILILLSLFPLLFLMMEQNISTKMELCVSQEMKKINYLFSKCEIIFLLSIFIFLLYLIKK